MTEYCDALIRSNKGHSEVEVDSLYGTIDNCTSLSERCSCPFLPSSGCSGQMSMHACV